MLAWKAPCTRAATGPVQVCGGCGGPQDIPRVTGDGRWLARASRLRDIPMPKGGGEACTMGYKGI